VILGGEDGLDFLLEAETAAEVSLFHHDKLTEVTVHFHGHITGGSAQSGSRRPSAGAAAAALW
jgi:hypothetical protein